MPEIAEAHSMANALKKTLVVHEDVPEGKLSITTIESRQQEDLSIPVPLVIHDVYAYGKKVVISTDKGLLVFSLGLNGTFLYKRAARWRNTFQIGYCKNLGSIYLIDEKLELFFHADHTGRLDFLATVAVQQAYFSNIGPDLLRYPPDQSSFRTRMRSYSQRKELCEVLLDQSVYAGVGNYLKSEILYLAQLHPCQNLASLTDSELETLRLCILNRVNQSYKDKGHYIKDYILPDGCTGDYIPIIYGRTQDPYGNPVLKEKFKDNRWTYYCPNVQKIPQVSSVIYSLN